MVLGGGGASRAIPPLRFSLGTCSGCCYGVRTLGSPGLLVLESWSQAAGLAIKRVRGGRRFGGVRVWGGGGGGSTRVPRGGG